MRNSASAFRRRLQWIDEVVAPAVRARGTSEAGGDGGRDADAGPTVRVRTDAGRSVPLGAVQAAQRSEHADDLARVLWWFLAALAALAAVAGAAGWLLAGRLLAPLRRITDSAREVSPETLDARLALDGPRDELHELAGALTRCSPVSKEPSRPSGASSPTHPTSFAPRSRLPAPRPRSCSPTRGPLRPSSARRWSRCGGRWTAVARWWKRCCGWRRPGTRPEAQRRSTLSRSSAPPGRQPLLRAMVDNLLANAIAYNESSGRVWVSVEEVGAEQLRLTVSNSGPRVDPAGVADLFEPFVRAEPSRSRRSGGAGLGLAIVRAVAVAHGGGARAEARPEGGMTVTVVVSREI